jgi:ribosomal protein L11 methyltransferase
MSDQGQGRIWYAVDIALEPPAREAVEYALMEAGALGTESVEPVDGLMHSTGYFADAPDREKLRDELFDALRLYNLETGSVREMNLREVPDRDWLGEWKKNWKPVEAGTRFIIAPPWAEIIGSPGTFLIRIEPGMAFGTGTHETTRLCLAAMEKYYEGGSFLDVGTGTGILAIAAAKLFPNASINACDTDEEAIRIARENAVLNSASNINFFTGSIGDDTPSAGCVVANLTADVIIGMIPQLIEASCGRLILSGILTTQEEQVRQSLHEHGVDEICEVMTDGEWMAIVC